jgi:hypothetical protein
MNWVIHVISLTEMRNTYTNLVGNPRNTKPREKSNILKKKKGYSMELIYLHRSTSDFFSGVFKT